MWGGRGDQTGETGGEEEFKMQSEEGESGLDTRQMSQEIWGVEEKKKDVSLRQPRLPKDSKKKRTVGTGSVDL